MHMSVLAAKAIAARHNMQRIADFIEQGGFYDFRVIPAIRANREQGFVSNRTHLTQNEDGELEGTAWPTVPARK